MEVASGLDLLMLEGGLQGGAVRNLRWHRDVSCHHDLVAILKERVTALVISPWFNPWVWPSPIVHEPSISGEELSVLVNRVVQIPLSFQDSHLLAICLRIRTLALARFRPPILGGQSGRVLDQDGGHPDRMEVVWIGPLLLLKVLLLFVTLGSTPDLLLIPNDIVVVVHRSSPYLGRQRSILSICSPPSCLASKIKRVEIEDFPFRLRVKVF